MKSISITELRGSLKEIMELASRGMQYQVTQHGKILAIIQAPKTHANDLQSRLAELRAGSKIIGDIINAPLSDVKWEDDTDFNTVAEPDVPYGDS